MNSNIRYLELKSGYSDDGPAWIGAVEFSKSGQTVYFDNKALKKMKIPGISGNHYDIETGEEYWVSGVKKNGADRHWAGGGKIMLDRASIPAYLELVDFNVIEDRYFDLVDFTPTDKQRFAAIENTAAESGASVEERESMYWERNRRKLNRSAKES